MKHANNWPPGRRSRVNRAAAGKRVITTEGWDKPATANDPASLLGAFGSGCEDLGHT